MTRRRLIGSVALLAIAVAVAAWALTDNDGGRPRAKADRAVRPWKVSVPVTRDGAVARGRGFTVIVRRGATGTLTLTEPVRVHPAPPVRVARVGGIEPTGDPVAVQLDGGRLGRRGAVLHRRLAQPLPAGRGVTFAYFDERERVWRPVVTRLSRDRRTATAAVDHFTDYGTWVHAVGAVTDTRVDAPDCDPGLPGWMQKDGVVFSDDQNAPVRWCAGPDPRDGSRLQVKVSVNRSYGVIVRPAVTPEKLNSGMFGNGPAEILESLVTRTLHAPKILGVFGGTVPVMGGQTATLSFTEQQVRQAQAGGPLIRVQLTARAALAGLVFGELADLNADGKLGRRVGYLMSLASIVQCETGVFRPLERNDWRASLIGLEHCGIDNVKTTTVLTARAAADLFPDEEPRQLGRIVGKAGRLLKVLGWGLKGASLATWGTDHALAKQDYELRAYAQLKAPRVTLLNAGDGALRMRPTTITGAGSGVACGVWSARHLQWQSWTADEAKATGTLVYNPGVGTCAAGALRSTRATFRFFRPKRHCPIYRSGTTIRESRSVFTRADIVASAPEVANPWHTSPAEGFLCH